MSTLLPGVPPEAAVRLAPSCKTLVGPALWPNAVPALLASPAPAASVAAAPAGVPAPAATAAAAGIPVVAAWLARTASAEMAVPGWMSTPDCAPSSTRGTTPVLSFRKQVPPPTWSLNSKATHLGVSCTGGQREWRHVEEREELWGLRVMGQRARVAGG